MASRHCTNRKPRNHWICYDVDVLSGNVILSTVVPSQFWGLQADVQFLFPGLSTKTRQMQTFSWVLDLRKDVVFFSMPEPTHMVVLTSVSPGPLTCWMPRPVHLAWQTDGCSLWLVGAKDGVWDELREANIIIHGAVNVFASYLSGELAEPQMEKLDPRKWDFILKSIFKAACESAMGDCSAGEQRKSLVFCHPGPSQTYLTKPCWHLYTRLAVVRESTITFCVWSTCLSTKKVVDHSMPVRQ